MTSGKSGFVTSSIELIEASRILLSEELPCKSFKGYFVTRFSEPFDDFGVSYHGETERGMMRGEGENLAGWVTFAKGTKVVDVRVGVSFISVEQARRYVLSSRSCHADSSRETWIKRFQMVGRLRRPLAKFVPLGVTGSMPSKSSAQLRITLPFSTRHTPTPLSTLTRCTSRPTLALHTTLAILTRWSPGRAIPDTRYGTPSERRPLGNSLLSLRGFRG